MANSTGIVAFVFILFFAIIAILLLPGGLDGITSAAVSDGSIKFNSYYPSEDIEIIGDCYDIELQIDYSSSYKRTLNEYFWFREKGKEFEGLRGARRTVQPQKDYTADIEVNVCKGKTYEWYACIGELSCAGKAEHFSFSVY